MVGARITALSEAKRLLAGIAPDVRGDVIPHTATIDERLAALVPELQDEAETLGLAIPAGNDVTIPDNAASDYASTLQRIRAIIPQPKPGK